MNKKKFEKKLYLCKKFIFRMEKRVGNIVDVRNRRIFGGVVTIDNGLITSVEETEVASDAPYIMPGFVDAHVHIESTLMTPRNFARMAVKHGTVAVVTDPHEIANVCGRDGIEFMIESAKSTKLKFSFGVPSCVPCTDFETAGAEINSQDVKELVQRGEFYGLAEMMNFPGILIGLEEPLKKVKYTLMAGKVVDGHAPGLTGERARNYIAQGITTDHEMYDLEQARERLGYGMKIQIREGSAACNLNDLMPLLAEDQWFGKLMFCTDDKYPDELEQGYINEMAARAVGAGMPLWNVLEAATTTPVEHYGLCVGGLRSGDSADFIVVRDLKKFEVLETFVGGERVYGDGEENVVKEINTERVINKFEAKSLREEDLRVETGDGEVKVIQVFEGQLFTKAVSGKPGVEDDILKLIVYNRYKQAKPAVGYIKGFQLKKGAMASTIAHDSHNIIALGCSDAEIVKAVNALVESKGGFCVTDGERVEQLPLPIGGLMSPLRGEELGQRHKQLKTMAKEIGCPFSAPFMTLAFMALPVIPELKLIDTGLFDGLKFGFTDLKITD